MTNEQSRTSVPQMNPPDSGPIPEAALSAAPATHPDFRLWRDAPAWRNLVLAAIGISTLLVTLPLMRPTTDQAASGPMVCRAKPLPSAGPARQGQVVGFLSTDQANSTLQRTQANLGMEISPDYVGNARSLVHLDGAARGSRTIYLVPQGMNVHAGDRVEVVGGRIDPALPCHYIPNLIARDLS
ncbi:MAG TPA: hypothetical protein VFW23_08330 [Tepidisphaeraceae bacterium]|nr:hypothetical protein [Tepidisphaeraceae bacterium]